MERRPFIARIRTQPGTGAEPMVAIATFAPPEPAAHGANYAQDYARGLNWSMVRVTAAVASMEGVMRQVMAVRTDYGAGHIEIHAVVLHDQTPEQVQRDLLAAVEAVPREVVDQAAALFAPAPQAPKESP